MDEDREAEDGGFGRGDPEAKETDCTIDGLVPIGAEVVFTICTTERARTPSALWTTDRPGAIMTIEFPAIAPSAHCLIWAMGGLVWLLVIA